MEPDFYHEHLDNVATGHAEPFPGEEHLVPPLEYPERYKQWLIDIDEANDHDERKEGHK